MTDYKVTPDNFEEIVPFVNCDSEALARAVFTKDICWFYDTCSFRKHANLAQSAVSCFAEYIRQQNGFVVITRTVLMELASAGGNLNEEYICYAELLNEKGVDVFVIYEEDLFHVLDQCYGTAEKINDYLIWGVRSIRKPVSTIDLTLKENHSLEDQVIKGKNSSSRNVYKAFFETVRDNKESGDNLGEEMIAICMHILSHLPGETDGKYCIITEDKGAAGMIDTLFKNTNKQYRGAAVGIHSTPKLVQMMHRDGLISDRQHIHTILSTGTDGDLIVQGTKSFDLYGKAIKLSCTELTDLILEPNGININF